jgi:DNA-binding MarR family transcriptional regulator
MTEIDRYGEALGQLLELVVVLNDDMTKGLARDGLTGPRANVLWELLQHGPSTQAVLAQAMRVSARNMTGLVDGLVATGFVTREPHPTDRRAILVSFTKQGAEAAEGLRRGHEELARLLFEGMPRKQFDCFVAGLDHVLARLAEHGATLDEARSDGA